MCIACALPATTHRAGARGVLQIGVDTRGWFWLIVGALQLLTGLLRLARNRRGAGLGTSFAAISAIMSVLAIFAWPLRACPCSPWTCSSCTD
jgi:hypothetical protein